MKGCGDARGAVIRAVAAEGDDPPLGGDSVKAGDDRNEAAGFKAEGVALNSPAESWNVGRGLIGRVIGRQADLFAFQSPGVGSVLPE